MKTRTFNIIPILVTVLLLNVQSYAQALSGSTRICSDGVSTTVITALACGTGTETWSSSNPSVASVASTGLQTGTVTSAGSAGTTTITYSRSGCTTATIVVTAVAAPAAGTISGNLNIWPTLTTNLSASGTSGGTWSSATTAVGTIDPLTGLAVGLSPGTTVITYNVVNVCGSDATNATLTVNPNPTMPGSAPTTLISGLGFETQGLNTAMIQGSTTGLGVANEIIALVYKNTNGTKLAIYDVTAGTGVTNIGLQGTPQSTPDVVIGNLTTVSPDDYRVAVAYTDGTKVLVEYYDFYADGTSGGFSVSGYQMTSTRTYLGASFAQVHIDGVVDYNATAATGYPLCKDAVVVWEDNSTSPSNIYASQIDLQSPPVALIPRAINTTNGKNPDVAGIIRTNLSNNEEMALITYTSANDMNLYYQEWNMTTNNLSAPSTIGTVGGSSTIKNPRIDAIDDFNINGTGTGNAYYKVAAEAYNGSTIDIVTFDPLLGTSGWPISNLVHIAGQAPPYNNYTPTVALATSTPDYMVAHFTDDGSGNDVVFMEPIDYSNSTALTSPGYYYWVSQNPATGGNTLHACSASSNCNDVSASGLVAWSLYNTGSTQYDIYYKITPCPTYSFKKTPGPVVKSNAVFVPQIYPNPTGGIITMNLSDAAKYSITDMAGRHVLAGNLQSGRQQVNLSRLVPGNYIVKVVQDNGSVFTKMIVKE